MKVRDIAKTLKSLRPKQPSLFRGQRGIGLTEVLVAVLIAGTAVVVFVSSLYTGSRSVGMIYEWTTADNLARSQLEYVKGQEYVVAPVTYEILPAIPPDFTISAEASAIEERDENIQRITVTVRRNGESVLVMEDFKVNR